MQKNQFCCFSCWWCSLARLLCKSSWLVYWRYLESNITLVCFFSSRVVCDISYRMEWNLLLGTFFIRVNYLVWHRCMRKFPCEFATVFLAGNLFIVCLLKNKQTNSTFWTRIFVTIYTLLSAYYIALSNECYNKQYSMYVLKNKIDYYTA